MPFFHSLLSQTRFSAGSESPAGKLCELSLERDPEHPLRSIRLIDWIVRCYNVAIYLVMFFLCVVYSDLSSIADIITVEEEVYDDATIDCIEDIVSSSSCKFQPNPPTFRLLKVR